MNDLLKEHGVAFDEKYLEQEEVTVVVQVNGKVRDVMVIAKDMESDEKAITKMAENSEKVSKFLNGKKAKFAIYVKGKVVNLVV